MKKIATLTIVTTLFLVVPFTSAISAKNRLRVQAPGTITQYPNNGNIIMLEHNKTGKCLDMDTDGGIHLRRCKGENDEKWKFVYSNRGFKFQSQFNNRYLKMVNGGYTSTANFDDATVMLRSRIRTEGTYLLLTYTDENNDSMALYGKKKNNGKYVLRVQSSTISDENYWILYKQ